MVVSVSIRQTKHGTWLVRWRDAAGRHRGKTFKTKALADAFEAQRLSRSALGIDTQPIPLWRRMVEGELGPQAAIDAGGFNPNGHFVYLLWGTSDDRPLYIGRSSNVLARLGSHMNNPARRHRIARVTLIRCFSAEVAAETEAHLIDVYQCELNMLDGSGRPRCAPDGDMGSELGR